MKLLLCLACNDIFSLHGFERSCLCGEARGYYINDVNAFYSGASAVPIGFDNTSFSNAVRNRPPYGNGAQFGAFVIPVICPTMKRTA